MDIALKGRETKETGRKETLSSKRKGSVKQREWDLKHKCRGLISLRKKDTFSILMGGKERLGEDMGIFSGFFC